MPEPRISARLKAAITRRASGCCEYCRCQEAFSPDPFVAEHILPRSRGGTDDESNLALACQGCNGHKYTSAEALDSVTGRLVALFHPRRDDWDGHFAWSTDFTRVIGVTPTGRATLEKLRLNRPGVINLRRVLIAQGEHPP